jgi:hypothetical protein
MQNTYKNFKVQWAIMPGNEVEVAKFIFKNLGRVELPHLGVIRNIGGPRSGSNGYYVINSDRDLVSISTPDASKKADIYLNGVGVSVKQIGGSFAFNRLQRANIEDLFTLLRFSDIPRRLARLDTEVKRFHEGTLERRNRPWEAFFDESDFRELLEYLMMKGSPNLGPSKHPARFILEAPSYITEQGIRVYSFPEYFEKYRLKFKVAIRRQWIGQASDSEHSRAVSLARKRGNAPWVFENVVGSPNSGWRTDFPLEQRRTVYFLMIEKET